MKYKDFKDVVKITRNTKIKDIIRVHKEYKTLTLKKNIKVYKIVCYKNINKWNKLSHTVIELIIPKGTDISCISRHAIIKNYTSQFISNFCDKFRSEKAFVLKTPQKKKCISWWNLLHGDGSEFVYKQGDIVYPHYFDATDRGCAPGIHFYLTKEQALNSI